MNELMQFAQNQSWMRDPVCCLVLVHELAGTDLSNCELARMAGCSHQKVRRFRAKLRSSVLHSLDTRLTFPNEKSAQVPKLKAVVGEGNLTPVRHSLDTAAELALEGETLETLAPVEPWITELTEEWQAYRREQRFPLLKPRSLKRFHKKLSEMGEERARAAIENSVTSGYRGLFEPKQSGEQANHEQPRKRRMLE